MKKILNKKLDEKAMLAGIFAFAALGFLYLYVAATVNNTEAPTKETSTSQVAVTTQEAQLSANGMKKYSSDNLKIEFEYPEDVTINQNLNLLDLKRSSIDYARVSVVASNFTNTRDHVEYLISKMPNTSVKAEYVSLNNIDWAKVNFNENEELVYFHVKEYTSYQLSTKNPSLFQDLEIIAKSFKILE